MAGLLKRVLYEAAARLATPIYSGVASILIFHRVAPRIESLRAGWPRDIEAEPALLETLVSNVRRAGHTLVSMDELADALAGRTRSVGKLVVVTFDDGYADTYDLAFPLLTGMSVPFTLYLTTDFPDRRMAPWWYLAERRLAWGSTQSLAIRGRDLSFRLVTQEQRDAAFLTIAAIFEALPTGKRKALAEEVFGEKEVARAMDELCIRWDEVAAMARHPLVTIGAHTQSHPVLKNLPRDSALREMAESRSRIEAEIGRPVTHFAYPYGSETQVGPREYALAKECGFKTAVTTRLANVSRHGGAHRECLPRVYGRTLREIELGMSGVVSAFRYRGKRVIAA